MVFIVGSSASSGEGGKLPIIPEEQLLCDSFSSDDSEDTSGWPRELVVRVQEKTATVITSCQHEDCLSSKSGPEAAWDTSRSRSRPRPSTSSAVAPTGRGGADNTRARNNSRRVNNVEKLVLNERRLDHLGQQILISDDQKRPFAPLPQVHPALIDATGTGSLARLRVGPVVSVINGVRNVSHQTRSSHVKPAASSSSTQSTSRAANNVRNFSDQNPRDKPEASSGTTKRSTSPCRPTCPICVPSYEDDQSATYVGSFPKGFGYDNEEPELEGAPSRGDSKPRILLMGLRRSGKSSIQKVVFHKVSPNETLFLESTTKIIKDDISNSSFVQFQIWDIPGQIDFFDQAFDSEYIFGGCGALIFVIDAQDDYMEALSRLQMAVTRAHKINEAIKFEVFIHKVDGLSDDNKIETQRDILQRATDELADAGMDNIQLSFYLTSIYDHSIFEAFSKVVQKLIPQLPVLENLLDIIISNSKIEKAFLFDVVSKIYIATDSSPVDMQCYELCCDMIDVVIDMSCIYGTRDDGAFDNESGSFIKLNSGTVLFLREVNRHLALVCILREDGCEHRGIIEYNFKCFRNAIQEVFVARNKQTSSTDGTEEGAIGLVIGSGSKTTGDPRMDQVVRSVKGNEGGFSGQANGLRHGMMNGLGDRDNLE